MQRSSYPCLPPAPQAGIISLEGLHPDCSQTLSVPDHEELIRKAPKPEPLGPVRVQLKPVVSLSICYYSLSYLKCY